MQPVKTEKYNQDFKETGALPVSFFANEISLFIINNDFNKILKWKKLVWGGIYQ